MQSPFLAIVGPESKRCLLATPTGIADSLDAEENEKDRAREDLTDVLGCTGPTEVMFHMTADWLVGHWRGALECTLNWLAPKDVSSDDVCQMLPDAHDVFGAGAIGRTRDMAIWAGSPDDSTAPPVEPEAYLDKVSIPHALRKHLTEALEAGGVVLAKGQTLRSALERIMVGTVLPTETAHERMAQRQRIAQDLKLFDALWAHDEEEGLGPVVPVFL